MDDNVGIWIDHRKAVIVSVSADRVSTKTLQSEIDPHSRYSGRAGSAEGPRGEGGEKKYEEHYRQQLGRYYDEVIGQLGQPKALLLFGPGEAKLQLKARLDRFKALAHCIVTTETTDKLTDPQIVEKIKDHYGVAR